MSSPGTAASPKLPNFNDRLPDLTTVLRQAGRDLAQSKPAQSYIPYFEDIFAVAHTLKGVTKLLQCPAPMEKFVVELCDALSNALVGTKVSRKNKETGEAFVAMAEAMDCDQPADTAKISVLMENLQKVVSLFTDDQGHEERLKDTPSHLFYVNEFVSKKAREITLLKLNHCVVEDESLLDDIPLWRTQLNEALLSPEFGRGLVVNFLPFLSPEGSRVLKIWVWIAAASHSRASLKQRIKDTMPKATITKL
ncbi:MAG TPA: hypothetical protein VIH99_12540 [Bdellovibrionota bacterium]|jgi:hypothetical protein